MATSKPRVRQATGSDFERVQPLLGELSSRVQAAHWQRLFENLWGEREFRRR